MDTNPMDAAPGAREEHSRTDSEPRQVLIIRDVDHARALRDPERQRLLEALAESPDSATGLARRLGDTRQRINYHLKTLQEAGAVEVREERRKGNCVERVLGVVARRFVLDPTALDDLSTRPEEFGDRFSADYLVALASRTIRDLARLKGKARSEGKRLATASLSTEVSLESPAEMAAFVDDLTEAVAGVVSKHHRPCAGARPFRVVLGAYPGGSEAEREDPEPDGSQPTEES